MAKFRVVCMNAQSSDGIVTESLPKTDLIRAAVSEKRVCRSNKHFLSNIYTPGSLVFGTVFIKSSITDIDISFRD